MTWSEVDTIYVKLSYVKMGLYVLDVIKSTINETTSAITLRLIVCLDLRLS